MGLEAVIWLAIVLVVVTAVLHVILFVGLLTTIKAQTQRHTESRQHAEQIGRLWTSMEQIQRRQVGLVARIADKVAPDD